QRRALHSAKVDAPAWVTGWVFRSIVTSDSGIVTRRSGIVTTDSDDRDHLGGGRWDQARI
ncbi:MAG: hypothetical protein WC247_17130, partial [Porticoccaceae bacterium]